MSARLQARGAIPGWKPIQQPASFARDSRWCMQRSCITNYLITSSHPGYAIFIPLLHRVMPSPAFIKSHR